VFHVDAQKKIGHDLHKIVLHCLLWWTCHSEVASAGLSRTGLITVLADLLSDYIDLNLFEKVSYRHYN
jgi:hypothetical protein